MRVGLYDDPIFREHDAGSGHPERPDRLEAVREGLKEAGLESELELREPRPATRGELLAVHSPEHVDLVAGTKDRTHRFDPDTQASPRSYEAALKAAEIDDFRFHDLRHTAASYLAMSGATLAEIAEVLGHKTLMMVKRYAHLTEQHTSAVVARMNERFLSES